MFARYGHAPIQNPLLNHRYPKCDLTLDVSRAFQAQRHDHFGAELSYKALGCVAFFSPPLLICRVSSELKMCLGSFGIWKPMNYCL
jgi:hypothetical protein